MLARSKPFHTGWWTLAGKLLVGSLSAVGRADGDATIPVLDGPQSSATAVADKHLQQATTGICIPLETRDAVLQRVTANRLLLGQPGFAARGPGGIRYPFFPQGGTLYQDITTGNFVDLDPATGAVRNYLCETYGNDAHEGIDTGGLTWEDMAIGQPVYAALDGTVVDVRDGDPDMNTSCQSGGNWVIIDHGGGREAWYFHLRRNSVAVVLGEHVRAGRQLGLVGSSGCSFGPHLHFQSMQNGVVYEPFAGACRTGPSGWVHQIDPPPTGVNGAAGAPFVRDMGVTTQDIGAAPPLPARAPVNNQIPLSAGGQISYWIQMGNLPANSTWRERYVRPDGSTEYQLGPFPFNNPTYQVSQYWFSRSVGGMATTSGTWRIQFEVNGRRIVDAPVEVVAAVSPAFNRPPSPISAILDPAVPGTGNVLFARVQPPADALGYRDPDWDIVRYRYQWRVNGALVRDLISVGMADALSSEFTSSGNTISVTVTAGDGVGSGLGMTAPPVVLTARICAADFNRMNGLTVQDIFDFLAAWFAGSGEADFDGVGGISVQDIFAFLNAWFTGC